MTSRTCRVAWCTRHDQDGDEMHHYRTVGSVEQDDSAGELALAVSIVVTTTPDGTETYPGVVLEWEGREEPSVYFLSDGIEFSPAEVAGLAPLLARAAELLDLHRTTPIPATTVEPDRA